MLAHEIVDGRDQRGWIAHRRQNEVDPVHVQQFPANDGTGGGKERSLEAELHQNRERGDVMIDVAVVECQQRRPWRELLAADQRRGDVLHANHGVVPAEMFELFPKLGCPQPFDGRISRAIEIADVVIHDDSEFHGRSHQYEVKSSNRRKGCGSFGRS
ncbi:MAG: hypothetical protein SH850_07380 [Planctomycetaceae bacterium]|nr:hypothetical protein [Planctomycetaceae bacterium]